METSLKSQLFQNLANLPGINIFNWKRKTARTEPIIAAREVPVETMTQAKLIYLANKYFKKVLVQDKYIRTLNHITSHYELEAEKMDIMQARHEQELTQIKSECQDKISANQAEILKSDKGKLLKKIKDLELRNEFLKKQATGNLLTNDKVSDLIALVEKVESRIDNFDAKRNAGKVSFITQRLKQLLTRLQESEASKSVV